jgi:hypothetical protein
VRPPAVLGLATLAVAGSSSCSSSLDIPTPPMAAQTVALAASYDTPTGSLDLEDARASLTAVTAAIPALHLDWFPQLASNLLTSLDQRIQGNGLPTNPDASVETHHFIVTAVIDLHRICVGWGDPAGPPDGGNGAIDATAVVQKGRLDAEVWGTATSCKMNLSLLGGAVNEDVMFSGTLILYLLGPLPTGASNERFLFQFEGPMEVAGLQSASTSIDFRVFDGALAFRLPVSDGDVIVEPMGSSVTLRASNGAFRCDLGTLSCQ